MHYIFPITCRPYAPVTYKESSKEIVVAQPMECLATTSVDTPPPQQKRARPELGTKKNRHPSEKLLLNIRAERLLQVKIKLDNTPLR